MMKKYCKQRFVAKADGLIYKVESIDIYNNDSEYNQINLQLICGWDYINPDESDIQGWVASDRFIEEVQYETIPHYYMDESVKFSLADNGYEVIEDIERFERFLNEEGC